MERRIAITGGGGALAQAAAGCFRDAGYQVEAPPRAELDVTDAGGVGRWFHGRRLELLVCNAGITRDAPLARLSTDAWNETLEVNLSGAARCAKAAAEEMVAAGVAGHIVFLSSYSALHPPVGQAAYATAKAALLGLTEGLARELGLHGIRVNALLPGFLETPMTAGLPEARRETVRREHALGRFNTPEAAGRFLLRLHEDLPHTSGQIFQLDSRMR